MNVMTILAHEEGAMHTMNTKPVNILARLVGFVQMAFGGLVFFGSVFEVLNLVFPTLVPVVQQVPLMRLHHTQPVVYYWTLLSNVVTVGLAAMLVRAGMGTVRGRGEASRFSRTVIRIFGCVVVGAVAVSGIYLVPPILRMVGDATQHATGIILLVSVASALGGLSTILGALYLAHGRILRRAT